MTLPTGTLVRVTDGLHSYCGRVGEIVDNNAFFVRAAREQGQPAEPFVYRVTFASPDGDALLSPGEFSVIAQETAPVPDKRRKAICAECGGTMTREAVTVAWGHQFWQLDTHHAARPMQAAAAKGGTK